VLHVDLNVFSNKDYRFAWLLLIPFVNYVRELVTRWREGGQEMLGEEEMEEEEEGEEDGGAGGLTIPGMGGMGDEATRQAIMQALQSQGGLAALLGGARG